MKRLLAAALYLAALAFSRFRRSTREMPHESCWSACTHPNHWTATPDEWAS